MSARAALIDPASAEASAGKVLPVPAAAHPLRAWRERQRLIDPATKQVRCWTVSDAARKYSAFIGRQVGPHTWRRWELPREDPESRIPREDMAGLRAFTGEQVTADDFYPPAPAPADGGG